MSKEQEERKQLLTDEIIRVLEKKNNIDYIRAIYIYADEISKN